MMTWLDTTRGHERAARDYGLFYRGFLKGVPNLTELEE
jgi:hypothetical protein